jgi:hypothetical protein
MIVEKTYTAYITVKIEFTAPEGIDPEEALSNMGYDFNLEDAACEPDFEGAEVTHTEIMSHDRILDTTDPDNIITLS